MELFNKDASGALFSKDKKYRYVLWRFWNNKPKVMYIGLNPSTANQVSDDRTISRVKAITDYNGFGGFYMMNCFPYVSTNPDELVACVPGSIQWEINYRLLQRVSRRCQDVVFAWGAFDIVRHMKIDKMFTNLFPDAKALVINKSGSPKHPLYCSKTTKLIPWI